MTGRVDSDELFPVHLPKANHRMLLVTVSILLIELEDVAGGRKAADSISLSMMTVMIPIPQSM